MGIPDDLPVALERLVVLSQLPNVNIKPVLLRVVVDMFLRKEHHAPADLAQFETIVSHLLTEADADARMLVADKLSRHGATPRALLEQLGADKAAIAEKIYEHAELGEETLRTAASLTGVAVAAAVARRRDLSPAVVAILVDRPELDILRDLVGNPAVTFDRPSMQKLVRRARHDHDLAAALVRRASDVLDLAPLYPMLDPEQRQAVIDATRRQDLGRRPPKPIDPPEPVTFERMDRLIRCGERDGFDAMLCAALGLEGARFAPLLHDDGGDILALALAAVGMPPDMAARVFILGDPRIGRSLPRVRALVRIVATVAPHAARRLVGAMAGGMPEPERRPRPVPAPSVPVRRPEAQPVAAQAPRREVPAAATGTARSRR